MLPSMSRPANPYDNATCESFLKTLKREEIHASTYHDFEDLQDVRKEALRFGDSRRVGQDASAAA
jgi:transposase InsO family protein